MLRCVVYRRPQATEGLFAVLVLYSCLLRVSYQAEPEAVGAEYYRTFLQDLKKHSVTKDQWCAAKPGMSDSAPEGCGEGSTTCLQSTFSKVWNKVDRKTLVTGAAVTAGAAAAVLAAPAALSAAGFGSAGVSAGSMAAGVQSTMGGVIAKGSLFSLCQSWGAAGLPAAAQAVTAATGAGGAAAAVHALDAARCAATKAGESLAAAGGSAATLVSAVRPIAVQTGTWMSSACSHAASAVKAGALAAGTRLGIGGDGAGTEPEKPPASRL